MSGGRPSAREISDSQQVEDLTLRGFRADDGLRWFDPREEPRRSFEIVKPVVKLP